MVCARNRKTLIPKFTARTFATFFGTGLAARAPGTVASALALLMILPIPAAWWPWAPLLLALTATLGCVLIARAFPSKGAGGDPGWFVLDEAAGMWLAVALPEKPALLYALVAFALFRVWDITKPPPLRRLERLGGGFGIVADDLGAGLYALLLTMLCASMYPSN